MPLSPYRLANPIRHNLSLNPRISCTRRFIRLICCSDCPLRCASTHSGHRESVVLTLPASRCRFSLFEFDFISRHQNQSIDRPALEILKLSGRINQEKETFYFRGRPSSTLIPFCKTRFLYSKHIL